MIKQAPSVARLAAMVLFALSCFGILAFLWMQFGGPMPLRPEGYRLKVRMPESALLVQEADVRIAGLDVGKVKKKTLQRQGGSLVEIEIEDQFAPVPSDTKAMLRQKALLGETYVELTPGSERVPKLGDGATLAASRVEQPTEIDELIRTFDEPTRLAFRGWVREIAKAIEGGRGQSLNNALGHLRLFTEDGANLLQILDDQEPALRRLIKNAGVTFGALNEREGQFRELVVNANNLFGALASRNDALAETIFVFPTFLDESRATLARLENFSRRTRPLVRDLQPVALQLRPTVHDLGRLAPDLERLFRRLEPVIDESPKTLPEARKVLRCLNGSSPCNKDEDGDDQPGVLESLHQYLPQLNPILSYANYYQAQVGAFFSNGVGSLNGVIPGSAGPGKGPSHYLKQFGIINSRGLGLQQTRPEYERGNSYPAPNFYNRQRGLGVLEAFDCKPAGGELRDAVDETVPPPPTELAPCFVQPPQLYSAQRFTRLNEGDGRLRTPPRGNAGREPSTP